jgi:hypothetical protein
MLRSGGSLALVGVLMNEALDYFMKLVILAQSHLLLDALDLEDAEMIADRAGRLMVTLLEYEAMVAAE